MQHLSEVVAAIGRLDREVTAIRSRVERGGSIGELETKLRVERGGSIGELETKLRTIGDQVVSLSARLDVLEENVTLPGEDALKDEDKPATAARRARR